MRLGKQQGYRFLVSVITLVLALNVQANDKDSIQGEIPLDTPTLGSFIDRQYKMAEETLASLLSVRGERTVENTLKPFDRLSINIENISHICSLIIQVHPSAEMRQAAEGYRLKAKAFADSLSTNQAVYQSLKELKLKKTDLATRYYLAKILMEYRREGIEKDEAIRARVRALKNELNQLSQEFEKNIRTDARSITVNKEEDLIGLPTDFIKLLPKDKEGRFILNTDYPVAFQILSYADNEKVRKQMYESFFNRAYPANLEVLKTMITKRDQLANLLGYKTWADYVYEGKMVGSVSNAEDFIEKVARASESVMWREYKQLLERKRKELPQATKIEDWERLYWAEKVKKELYSYDSNKVREYFPFEQVKTGVLDITSKLFKIEYKRNLDIATWHPSVECLDVWSEGKLVGRAYLDLFPRPDKVKQPQQITIKSGVVGVQIPEAALICNFPGGKQEDPGLLDHLQVRMLFHEFGHVLHTILGGNQEWVGISGIKTEIDFAETPSQVLEELAWNRSILKKIGRHYKSGEAIPDDLLEKMEKANDFGKGLSTRRQIALGAFALALFSKKDVGDIENIQNVVMKRYLPFEQGDDVHFYSSFIHLDKYSAMYITYTWSQVIAKDLFSKFNSSDLLNPETSMKYRRTILDAGGSKPAEQLVKNFLTRPFNTGAWERWLMQ
jgi:thimet oligopeptidase